MVENKKAEKAPKLVDPKEVSIDLGTQELQARARKWVLTRFLTEPQHETLCHRDPGYLLQELLHGALPASITQKRH